MEGEMKRMKWKIFLLALLVVSWPLSGSGQGKEGAAGEVAAQIELRKTPLKTREYQGRLVEGEERIVRRGDSLWRILIQEKGLSKGGFGRYVVLIQSLNPNLKNPDILRLGDTIFVPIRPDEILGIKVAAGKEDTEVYRVRPGDYVYKILREKYGLKERKEISSAFNRVKELNPGKKNWDLLFIGELVLFPARGSAATASREPGKAAPGREAGKPVGVVGLDHGRGLPARENLNLLRQIVEALGNEIQHQGEEVVALKEGTVYIDRARYPVVQNPGKEQKVILDLEERIPASLRTKLEGQESRTPVVSVKKGGSLHDAVSGILSRLGFQSLPSDQPVVIQDGGVGVQVKGEWMVIPPEGIGRKNEVFVISLTDLQGKTPDYLTNYLSLRGMNLREILLPSPPVPPALFPGKPSGSLEIETLPRDKNALVDAFLRSNGISFSTDHPLSVSLREGIRVSLKADRFFEVGGVKVALFYTGVGDETRKALQERLGIRAVALDLSSLSARELLGRLLVALGEQATYREQRFPVSEGGAKERVVVAVAGFFLPKRSLLLTDQEIPRDLHPFFSHKGIRVVYFR